MMGAALGTALRHMNGKRVIEKGHAESCKTIADTTAKAASPYRPRGQTAASGLAIPKRSVKKRKKVLLIPKGRLFAVDVST